MTNIEQKALELSSEAWALTIEERNALQAEFDAFRQEVSDAVVDLFEMAVEGIPCGLKPRLRRFILTQWSIGDQAENAKHLRAALAKRGLEIREKSK